MKEIDVSKIELSKEQIEIYNEVRLSLKRKGQAAILLRPGGGKSYISLKMVNSLVGSRAKGEYEVLWISTKTSCDNIISLIGNHPIKERITFVHYDTLATNEKYVDSLKLGNIKLIVIDEAHGALACNTYKGIKYTLNKYHKAKLLAMTATKMRYSDRKRTFEVLTPDLILGVDYKDRGLEYSVKNNLTCDFEYKVCDIGVLREYCSIIKDLQSVDNHYTCYDPLVQEANKLIEDYSINTYKKIGEQLRKDLRTDGSKGDRWFVFYRTIDELQANRQEVHDMFVYAYNNPDITVNLIEFHDRVKDDKGVMDKINSVPNPNTVDIILTCNKGTQSIHPDNTRGIIMQRKTCSHTILEQQLGRCLETRSSTSGCAIIYDLVNNRDNKELGDENVAKTLELNQMSIESRFAATEHVNDEVSKLSSRFGDFDINAMDDDIAALMQKFKSIKLLYESMVVVHRIGEIFREEVGDNYLNLEEVKISPKKVLREYDDRNYTVFLEQFNNIQTAFISGEFGEHTADEPIKDIKDAYSQVYEVLGDILYISDKKDDYMNYNILDLRRIANEIRGYDFDYRNRISRTKQLKQDIAQLRRLNLEGRMSDTYRAYCIRNCIDINGRYANLIEEVLESKENINSNIVKEFKLVSKNLEKVREIDIHSIKPADKRVLMKARASYQVFTVRYDKTPFGRMATIALKSTYKDELEKTRIVVSGGIYEACKNDIKAIRALEVANLKDYSQIHSKPLRYEEEVVMNLVTRSETNNIDMYELMVLECLGIEVFNSRMGANIRKLLDMTPFGIIYESFLQEPTTQKYNMLMRYKQNILPDYIKKQLNKRTFAQKVISAEKESLLKKDNEEIKRVISEYFYVDESTRERIKKAIRNKEVDSRNLIKYALPTKILKMHPKEFNALWTKGWEGLSKEEREVVQKSLVSGSNGYEVIIENLIESSLVPDVQLELAKKLISLVE